MTLPYIKTPRAHLTLLTPDKAGLILDFYQRNRAHLTPWEPLRDAYFYTLPYWHGRLQDSYSQCFNGTGINLVALDPAGEQVIAICNASNIMMGIFKACHLGYAVDQHYQGQGLMQEILTAVINYLFHERGLHRIMACYMPTNRRSGVLLARLGFEREGYAREYLLINGRWEDHILTSLINPAP
ncbi:GNAT family N-acetyltransferase [Aeromonas cavernicola]|uniref:30S ribosomal protein S5 alanine N-acetyltransferase n=1 Tax=Aeromonas cavernicola TaxID=1006623 RepID=A0A2H9U6D2_9GAMM|nr:GNAT family N-acetyltransferase [Aeromonas cavernicola]PJG59571.1 30S ribosomal protein S5 alanine N-acetyltransferase [Aeromonas cavernicola]